MGLKDFFRPDLRPGSTMRAQASAFWSLRLLIPILSGLTIVVLAAYPKTASGVEEQTYAVRREQMIRTIDAQVHNLSSTLSHNHIDTRVLEVMGAIPRHEFVPEDLLQSSYEDRPLPIGFQPLIVALMTDVLNVDRTSLVLEVGTGSGYQAAVAAALARQVYTIEVIPELAHRASDRLHHLGYTNVATRVGDEYFGWEDAGPFDGIIVTAVAAHIPPLLQQLEPGERMVIPVARR